MTTALIIRPIKESDFSSWSPLWEGYNAFYGKVNETALDPEITKATWQRFFDLNEPVFALVAESQGKLVGVTHYLYHRSTSRLGLVTYLQDLFTEPSMRGKGVGRALINGVTSKPSRQIRAVFIGKHMKQMPQVGCFTTK